MAFISRKAKRKTMKTATRYLGTDARCDARTVRWQTKADPVWQELNREHDETGEDDLLWQMARRIEVVADGELEQIAIQFGNEYFEQVRCNLTELQMMACGLM